MIKYILALLATATSAHAVETNLTYQHICDSHPRLWQYAEMAVDAAVLAQFGCRRASSNPSFEDGTAYVRIQMLEQYRKSLVVPAPDIILLTQQKQVPHYAYTIASRTFPCH
jgi:hypothetical protein